MSYKGGWVREGGPLRSEAVMLEHIGGRRDVIVTHANNGRLVAGFGTEEFHGNAAHGIGIDLVDLVRHFGDWDLASVHEHLELR